MLKLWNISQKETNGISRARTTGAVRARENAVASSQAQKSGGANCNAMPTTEYNALHSQQEKQYNL